MFRNREAPSPFSPAPRRAAEPQEPRTEPEEVVNRVLTRILERRRQGQTLPEPPPQARPDV